MRQTNYQRFVFPYFVRQDAETIHKRTLNALAFAQQMALGRTVLRKLAGELPQRPSIQLFNLTFPNVIGMAAGFDKDVRVAEGLALLGFGHIEVGTLTPRPQVGNPRPRIFRLPDDGAIINRMGFPNDGVANALPRLKALSQIEREFVLGVSLGKHKETPLVNAVVDYLTVMTAVYPYADYLAVNISSPNTPGLRELQGGDYLGNLLGILQDENVRLAQKHGMQKRPLLVKIAPDLTTTELDTILQTIRDIHIDGIIAANTTLSREGLTDTNRFEQGGMSGRPLAQRATEIIHKISRLTKGNLPIIGVGGIRTAADVQEKLNAGATLVQLYTGLVYEGPGVVGNILRELTYNSLV